MKLKIKDFLVEWHEGLLAPVPAMERDPCASMRLPNGRQACRSTRDQPGDAIELVHLRHITRHCLKLQLRHARKAPRRQAGINAVLRERLQKLGHFH